MARAVASVFGGGQSGAAKASAAAAAKAQEETKQMVAKQEEAAAAEKKDLQTKQKLKMKLSVNGQTKQNATLNASRKRRGSYRSLIFGSELGTDKRETLG